MSKQTVFITIIATAMFSALSAAAVMHFFFGENTQNSPDEISIVKQSLLKLEKQLAIERVARTQLETRLFNSETERFGSNEAEVSLNELSTDISEPVAIELVEAPQEIDTQWTRELSASAYKVRLLTEAGISEDQAKWIVRTESEAALTALNDQYQARREQVRRREESGEQFKNTYELLRDEIGDENYERYLEANGWPTSVQIDSVMERSPGQNAGLEPGDNILTYDNQRIFNVRELNALTAAGDEGESILIEVNRAGETLQLTIPRGPIGISSGRRRFGR